MCTAYQPQSNGMVECFNQIVQCSLIKLTNEEQTNWDQFIDCALFGYKTSILNLQGLLHLTLCIAGEKPRGISITIEDSFTLTI